MDTVFVALSYWNDKRELPVLYWVLDHFENNKPKIVITYPYTFDADVKTLDVKNMLEKRAQSDYLPKCRAKKFQAEVLLHQGKGYDNTCVELVTKHGMQKLVCDDAFRSEVIGAFDKNPNICCKIWFVNINGVLTLERTYGPDILEKEVKELKKIVEKETTKREEAQIEVEKLKKIVDEKTIKLQDAQMEIEKLKRIIDENTIKGQEAQMEVEKLKKIVDEDTIKRQVAQTEYEKLKNVEEKLQQMIEQANTYEQRIDQLKESWALNTNFNFEELKQATQNFSDSLKIGGSRSGSVYKGTFRGTTVAIKKFESQDMQELSLFRQEIVILTTVRHPNLVNLIGACSEPPILVYEFLSKGSLRNCLTNTSNTTPLPWQVRTRIIGQICLALLFLHSNMPTQIVHGNLKPNNIFLDTNYTVKLSDFGLIIDTDTDINASLAYIDPEYLITGEMKSESDVYSFGMIIMYLLTGKCHLRIRQTIEGSMRTGEFHTMIDVSAGRWPLHHAEEMTTIGIRCADVSRSKRPNLVNEVWPTIERLVKFSDEIINDNPPLLGQSHM